MIIDFHTHLGAGLTTKSSNALYDVVTSDQLVHLLDSAGIDMAVTFAPSGGKDLHDPNYEKANEYVYQEISRWPNRLIGYARINPNLQERARKEAEKCISEYRFRGIKFNPSADGFRPSDVSLLQPFMELAYAHSLPVIFHAGYEPVSQPSLFLPLAENFPNVKIVLAHIAYRMAGDALVVAKRLPNIYVETSGNWDDLIRVAIRVLGAHRVLFGSNLPYQIPEVEKLKITVLDISQTEQEQVLGHNVAFLHNLFI